MNGNVSKKDGINIALPRYSKCFVCGKENTAGLDISFFYTNGRIETTFMPEPQHNGYHEIVHGGILATLLDETMGWTSIISRPTICVAAELTVRYKAPAKIGKTMLIHGELMADKKRIILSKGSIVSEDGTLLCTGEGKYVPLSDQALKEFIAQANWGDSLAKAHEKIKTLNKS
jgi:uncharacterized protein (TIGR00369 family)